MIIFRLNKENGDEDFSDMMNELQKIRNNASNSKRY